MLGFRIARHLLSMVATVLLGGLLAATMVRLAPGADVDEQQLDPHLSAESLQALRASRQHERNVLPFYWHYLANAAHGELGTSHSLDRPVAQLLRDRFPVTMRLIALGLGIAWLLAIALAFSAVMLPFRAWDLFSTSLSGLFLCIPAAVLALFAVILNVPVSLAIAVIVFPKIFRYVHNLLAKTYRMEHITTARAKGLSETRVLLFHAIPVAAPQILALAGISVSLALGASIPVEALCGIPGIGQLAWQAALGRDLPLLVNLTVVVTLVTLLANSGADVIAHVSRSKT